MPYQIIPYDELCMYNNTIQEIGNLAWFSEIHYLGNPESLNFQAFYVKGNLVYKVVGTSKKGEMQIYNEAMKLGLMPTIDMIRTLGERLPEYLTKKIRVSQKTDCRNPRGVGVTENCCTR